jgi:hypothetical protein
MAEKVRRGGEGVGECGVERLYPLIQVGFSEKRERLNTYS